MYGSALTRKARDDGNHRVWLSKRALQRAYPDRIIPYKFDDAIKYLEEAALFFLISHQFRDAGICYHQAASLFERTHSQINFIIAGSLMHKAALSYCKVDIKEMIACYMKGISYYCQAFEFQKAAFLEFELSMKFEDNEDWSNAGVHYLKAEKLFLTSQSGQGIFVYKCIVSAAKIATMEDKYVEAAEIFLRAAQMSFNFNLLRFNASEFLFFSLICHVAMGQVEKLEEKLLQYQSLDITFLDSNYHLFIVNIVDAIKRNDIDGFADHLYNFDSVVQLEPWCLRALQGIPAKIENCILISKNLELADAAESANESCEQLEQSKIEKCSVQVQPEGVEVQHEKDIEVNPEKEVLELKLSNFEKIKMKLQNIFFNEGNDDGYEMESKLSSNSSGSLYDSFEMTN